VRYGYDPGCARPTEGEEPDASVRAVTAALGLTLEEIEDPGDGVAGALTLNGIAAYARVGRVLALASRQLSGRRDAATPTTVVTPCSDCFLNLARASHALGTHPDLREKVAEELAGAGLSVEPGAVRVRHLLDVLCEDLGGETIRVRVRRPLTGLRVAPYYGCLWTRDGGAGAERETAVRPGRLESLLSALGADVLDSPLKGHCCGGRAAEASEETATSLQHRILRSARDQGADVIATVCPRCERNLASGQGAVNRRFGTRFAIPVRYFTGLVADAFGLDGSRPPA
jgi:heterodisulfide reductase subunit B